MKTTLAPYLNFVGKTKEAMTFYQSVFGGELKMQTFAEAGMGDDTNSIIHAELATDMFTFYASDGDATHPVHPGDNVQMCLGGSDEEQLTKFFNALSEGGDAHMPLAKQFWGDTYGQLTDKFGIHWMVNISSK